MRIRGALILCMALFLSGPALAAEFGRLEALFTPGRDLLDLKLEADNLVAPALSIAEARVEIDHLSKSLLPMAAMTKGSHAKLKILRRFMHEPGPWNDYRPFTYDLADPLGKKSENRLLSNYLKTRRGNCVTMPMLAVILGRKLGLDMTLALAPFHVFVKLKDEAGQEWNLEATSGLGYSRDAYCREKLPMTDLAVTEGTYLKAMNAGQVAALVASIVVEHHMQEGEPEQAIAAADVILKHAPGFAAMHIYRGSAYALILKRDIVPLLEATGALPDAFRIEANLLLAENQAAFERAEALGWSEHDGITTSPETEP